MKEDGKKSERERMKGKKTKIENVNSKGIKGRGKIERERLSPFTVV